MEKIDLTKCNNCRFRAEISNSGPVSGRIVVDKGVYLVDEKGDFIGFLSLDGKEIMSVSGCITDFEIIPRDPETYRDWQVGDKVCEDEHRNACYEVIFRSGELVVFKDWNNWASNPMTCSEAFTRFGMRLVLTDIEEKIIEEKKKYEPQDGDVCFVKTAAGNCFIFIFRKKDGENKDEMFAYIDMVKNGRNLLPTEVLCVCDRKSVRELRPATDEEKQRLFDAMAKEGKRWNAENKVVEDIPKPYEFKKGEPVLVRTNNGKVWVIRSFLTFNPDLPLYETSDGVFMATWRHCLPYNERTMHLLGTSEDYKEE